jgi:hypothetical protein
MNRSLVYHLIFAVSGAVVSSVAATGQEQLVLAGSVHWTDEGGNSHPIRFACLEAWNARTNRPVAKPDTSDALGAFELTLPTVADPVFIRVSSRTAGVRVLVNTGRRDHFFDSEVRSGAAISAPMIVVVPKHAEANGAFSILDALTYGQTYAASLVTQPLAPVRARYPADRTIYRKSEGTIEIGFGDRWDWDVVLHEYGHHLGTQLGLDQSPGGSHKPWQNLAENSSDPEMQLSLAWSEGMATFFSISSQRALDLARLHIPRVGDGRYTDPESKGMDYAVDSLDQYKRLGQDNTVAIARILYDLIDSVDLGSDDPLALDSRALWKWLNSSKTKTLPAAWNALTRKGSLRDNAEIGSIFGAHGAAARLKVPAPGSVLQGDAPEFRWSAPIGYPLHDQFALEIFDKNGTRVLRFRAVSERKYTPTPEEWALVRATDAPLFWVVHSWRTGAPIQTYMSASRTLAGF